MPAQVPCNAPQEQGSENHRSLEKVPRKSVPRALASHRTAIRALAVSPHAFVYSPAPTVSATVIAFKGEALDLTMSCGHNPDDVRIKRYSQREFFLSVDRVDLQEEARKYREWVAAGKLAGGPH